jgi:hypothetical protein
MQKYIFIEYIDISKEHKLLYLKNNNIIASNGVIFTRDTKSRQNDQVEIKIEQHKEKTT